MGGLGVTGPRGGAIEAIDRQWCVMELDEDADASPSASGEAARGFVQDIRIQPSLSAVKVDLQMTDGSPTAIKVSSPLCPDLDPLLLPLEEQQYWDNEQVVVCDRMRNNWFGRPIVARCA